MRGGGVRVSVLVSGECCLLGSLVEGDSEGLMSWDSQVSWSA